jgi:hypothetical protein
MRRHEERLIAFFLARQPEADRGVARILTRVWLWGTPLIFTLMAMYIANDLRCQLAVQVLTVVSGVVVLACLRLGAPLWVATQGSLTVTVVAFTGSALAQTPVPARVVPVDPSHAHPGVLLVTRASRPRAAARC